MAFGKKMDNLKTLKKTLEKGGSNSQWIRYVPKNSTMNVRFLTEPEGWVNYVEHYDQTARKSYPCNPDAECPGCRAGDRKTSRYLANVLDIEADKGVGRAIALQLPKDLANRIVVKYEKWGTIMDRDIELSRSGEGLDTIYDLDADTPSRRKIDKFQLHDLEKVLEDSWNDLFGEGASTDDDDDEDEAPKKASAKTRARTKSRAAQRMTKVEEPDDDEDEEEEDDEEDEAPVAKKKPAAKKPAPKPKFQKDEDDDEDDDDEEDEDEDDEEEEDEEEADEDDSDDDEDEDDDEDGPSYTVEELKAMPMGQFRRVCRDEFGIAPGQKTRQELIKAIQKANDEEVPF